jgi:hypothetical protein
VLYIEKLHLKPTTLLLLVALVVVPVAPSFNVVGGGGAATHGCYEPWLRLKPNNGKVIKTWSLLLILGFETAKF